MTREEQIKQAATTYADTWYTMPNHHHVATEAFIAGAHSRDEEIKELKHTLDDAIRNYERISDIALEKLSVISELNNEVADYKAAFQVLEAEIKKLRNPWISVEERLPEEDGKTKTSKVVFIRTDRGLSTSAWYNFETKKWHLFIGFLSGDDDVIDDTITNWMPIPITNN